MTAKVKEGASNLDFQTIDPPERKRTYVFENCCYELTNVSRLAVSERGTHRLEADGGLYIVPPTWLAIQIDDDKWDF